MASLDPPASPSVVVDAPPPSATTDDDSPPPPAGVDALEPDKRVSFYVQAVDEMLDAVLAHEAFLFDPNELAALVRFRNLEYQSRYLFSRLLLRKPTWIRLSSLLASSSYSTDISDLPAACAELWRVAEPVAGPSTPPKRQQVAALVEPKKEQPRDEGFLDLTLTDSDDDVAPPVSNKGKKSGVDKGKARATPRKLISDVPDSLDLGDLSRFAFDQSVLVDEPPENTLALLSMDELTTLGKRMKVPCKSGASRGEWTKALLKTSNQSTLSFFLAAPPTPKVQSPVGSAGMERKPSVGSVGVGYDAKGNKLSQSRVVAAQALKLIGPVIRLSPALLTLFNRLSLVYHRTSYTAGTSSTSASPLTASLLARFGKRAYPTYTVSRSFALFPSRAVLREFEAAMAIEQRVEAALDGVWGPGVPKRAERETKEERLERYGEGVRAWEEIEGEWSRLCAEAEDEARRVKKEEDEAVEAARAAGDGEGEGKGQRGAHGRLYYRRRFHPGWPLSRAAYKAAACYAKLGDHDSEVAILRHLLAQTSFRRGKRGDWYDRLALVLMKYPLGDEALLGDEVKGKKRERKDRLLRERRDEALRVCEEGLKDPFTHLIYKSSLQRRIARIESALQVPPDERRTFDVLLAKSTTRVMEGERVDTPTIGKKSVWRASDGAEISVEELCLEQFHSENGVLTMIFALTFWDILFAPVDGVFETAFQTAPLDLSSDAFAIVRRPAIDARLASIAAGDAPALLRSTDERERPRGTFAVGTNWERYAFEDLEEIAQCIGGPALASILTVFVEEYGHRTGGIPDLCLWNPSTGRALFAEIKGPGDQLSETQKVWIDVLLGAGVGVEVTRVVESREGREASAGEEEGEGEDGEEGGAGGKRGRARSKSAPRKGGKGRKRAKTVEEGEGEGE
ncbi:hypothetical protein JCM3775_005748 [Rhodotorula graminis]